MINKKKIAYKVLAPIIMKAGKFPVCRLGTESSVGPEGGPVSRALAGLAYEVAGT